MNAAGVLRIPNFVAVYSSLCLGAESVSGDHRDTVTQRREKGCLLRSAGLQLPKSSPAILVAPADDYFRGVNIAPPLFKFLT